LYLSDHREEIARKVSDKIQLAMRFNLYNEQFASENYQTMNYGIGGTISGHVDSMGIHDCTKLIILRQSFSIVGI
jgi:hypothetical protein